MRGVDRPLDITDRPLLSSGDILLHYCRIRSRRSTAMTHRENPKKKCPRTHAIANPSYLRRSPVPLHHSQHFRLVPPKSLSMLLNTFCFVCEFEMSTKKQFYYKIIFLVGVRQRRCPLTRGNLLPRLPPPCWRCWPLPRPRSRLLSATPTGSRQSERCAPPLSACAPPGRGPQLCSRREAALY